MNDDIAIALQVLAGLPLRELKRVAGLLFVGIGERRVVVDQRAQSRSTIDYAIVIQCPWRISSARGALVGSRDIGFPADPTIPDEEFDPREPGNSAADGPLADLLAQFAARPLIVHGASTDRCGGFVVRLSEGFALEVFVNAAARIPTEREQWRLMRGADTSSFVVSDRGHEERPASHDSDISDASD